MRKLIKEKENSKCHICKQELNQDNVSYYRIIFNNGTGGDQKGFLCVFCREFFNRFQECICGNNTKSEDEIKSEIENEGWTAEMLKIKEEMEYYSLLN